MASSLIGSRVERKEDKKFLTGKGRYTSDINLTNQTYAYFVRSPHARATISKVDTSKASNAPGVVKILTGEDLAKDKIGGLICGWKIVSQDGTDMKCPAHPPLANNTVNFVGDHVAIVIAETLDQAKNAAEKVRVDYKVLKAVVNTGEAINSKPPIISDYKIKSLFTAPTAFRAIKKEDPEGKFFSKYDLSSFKSLFLAGERADPDTIKWAENLLKVPVIDHWWQTETSWAISSNCTGIEMQKTKYGSACKAVPGYDVKIIKPDQSLAKPNEMGDIVVKLPLPPGTFPTLWNADKRYKENYMSNYKGYYQTYDAGHIDEDGYIWIMSRTDDIINVAGHRLSTGAIEEVLSEHQSVAECAVLGIKDQLKGQLPIGLIALKAGVSKDNETISKECVQIVRDKGGPVAAFKIAIVVKRLPKTRSGKILRGTIRKIADNEEYKMPATIDDPAILDEIKQDLINNNILK